jgi:uncharacterized damage-inducible protein DinB
MKQELWFSRKFDFTSDQNVFPSIIERLSGTPVRLEEKLRSVPEDVAALSPDGSWSIRQNIGHLTDLEPLWRGRVHDILSSQPTMRAADLQNTKTHQANHNELPLATLLKDFRQIRKQTLDMLEGLTEEDVFKSALHPRLTTPMRVMDLFLFVAEHDDHHLAKISELIKMPALKSKS